MKQLEIDEEGWMGREPADGLPSWLTASPRREPTVAERVEILVSRAKGGDRTAAPQLRKLFDEHPNELMRLGAGNLAETAKELVVARAVKGNDELAKEAKRRRIDQIRDELAGLHPTPIERILAERASLCWAEAHFFDARVLTAMGEGSEPRRLLHLDLLRDRAHRRFLAAVKTLATVRKLAVPALQINIADKQVNQVLTESGR